MLIPPEYRPAVLRVAQHEAGHYIVARVLGFDVGAIRLTVTDFQGGHTAGSEITLARPVRTTVDAIQYLESRVVILYAGALSESLKKQEIDNDLAKTSLHAGGGARDFDKIKELLNVLRNLRFPDALGSGEPQASLTALDQELINQAGEIVLREVSLIEGLASRIASEIKMHGKQYEISEAELKAMPALVARFTGAR